MPPKTLDQEVRGLNDGLVSMDAIEAPSDNLPVVKKEEGSGIKGKRNEDYQQLDYLCMQVGKDKRYLPLLEEELSGLLFLNGFIDIGSSDDENAAKYHKRVRKNSVDYLFPEYFADKEGTFGITLNFDESEKFDNLFDNYWKELVNVKVDNYSMGGMMLGMLGGAILGVLTGNFSYHELGFDDVGAAVSIGVATFFSGMIGGTFFGSSIGKKNVKKAKEKLDSMLKEIDDKQIKRNPAIYNLDIINHYLNLPP